MRNDDDMLEGIDLSAWEAPPPPADLADAVVHRMGATSVGAAVPIEDPREPRRAWPLAAVAVAVLVLAVGVWSVLRDTSSVAPATGNVVADRARTLSLETVRANLDAGAGVRWERKGSVLYVEQRAGSASWHVDGGERLVIDAGAGLASVEATGANVRVEVQMNATDARVIGASALTAAAVAMVTVVVYEGHVKAGRAGQPMVVVTPGSTYQIKPEQPAPIVSGTVDTQVALRKRVAVLALDLFNADLAPGSDAYLVTSRLVAALQTAANTAGPYELAEKPDEELVDQKRENDCEGEAPPCMAAIGAKLGVDLLVFGKVEWMRDHYRVTLKLLDVGRQAIVRSGHWTLPGDNARGTNFDDWGKKIYLSLVDMTSATVTNVPVTLDRATISSTLTSFQDAFTACADLADGGGKVVVDAIVEPYGRVTSVTIAESPNDKLGVCVRDAFEKLQFPETQSGGSFSYPFVF